MTPFIGKADENGCLLYLCVLNFGWDYQVNNGGWIPTAVVWNSNWLCMCTMRIARMDSCEFCYRLSSVRNCSSTCPLWLFTCLCVASGRRWHFHAYVISCNIKLHVLTYINSRVWLQQTLFFLILNNTGKLSFNCVEWVKIGIEKQSLETSILNHQADLASATVSCLCSFSCEKVFNRSTCCIIALRSRASICESQRK